MPTERTDSSCQVGSVSQNQIRQCEHDIEFGSLLLEPSVSCFSETQLFLDDTEYVLYFRADRGLCVFCFLCGILAAFAQFLHLGWTTVDSVFDFAASLVDEPATVALMDAYLEQNGYVMGLLTMRLEQYPQLGRYMDAHCPGPPTAPPAWAHQPPRAAPLWRRCWICSSALSTRS